MHRIDHATAVDEHFTEGNVVGGLEATVVTDDFLNAVQDEIANVVEEAGITLDKADNTQLYQAILALAPPNATTLIRGILKLATNAAVQAGNETDTVVTPAGLASFAKSLAINGYARLPGGRIEQWLLTDDFTSETYKNITWPIPFPNACLNVQATVVLSSLSASANQFAQTYGWSQNGCSIFLNFSGSEVYPQKVAVRAIGY